MAIISWCDRHAAEDVKLSVVFRLLWVAYRWSSPSAAVGKGGGKRLPISLLRLKGSGSDRRSDNDEEFSMADKEKLRNDSMY